MHVNELLDIKRIKLKQNYKTKADILDALIELHSQYGYVTDKRVFRDAIIERESQISTAIENGVMIPHAISSSVSKASLAIISLENAIDCNSFDGKKSDLFIMIAVPDKTDNEHLKILQKLMGLLIHQDFLLNTF